MHNEPAARDTTVRKWPKHLGSFTAAFTIIETLTMVKDWSLLVCQLVIADRTRKMKRHASCLCFRNEVNPSITFLDMPEKCDGRVVKESLSVAISLAN